MRKWKEKEIKPFKGKNPSRWLKNRDKEIEEREAHILSQFKKNEKYREEKLHKDLDPITCVVLQKKAPKLLEAEYPRSINRILEKFTRVRDLKDWKPKGKAGKTLFASLGHHLIAEYKVPDFLWNALLFSSSRYVRNYAGLSNNEIDLIEFVSKGGSYYLAVRAIYGVPFTRKMAHVFANTPREMSITEGIRRAQIEVNNGRQDLLATIMKIRQFEIVSISQKQEEFLYSFIVWACNNPMLNPDMVSHIFDYVNFQWYENQTFSMKGRSANALIRDTDFWHKSLGGGKVLNRKEFPRSGYVPFTYTIPPKTTATTHTIGEIWHIKEITNNVDLKKEGSILKHCVYSYSQSIDGKNCSIWSMTCNDYRTITIDVRNGIAIQASGKFNRGLKNREYKIIHRWAAKNNIGMRVG